MLQKSKPKHENSIISSEGFIFLKLQADSTIFKKVSSQVFTRDICSEKLQLASLGTGWIGKIWQDEDSYDISCFNIRATTFEYAPFTTLSRDDEGILSYGGLEVSTTFVTQIRR